ncbi:MAG: hypothetical protein L0323_16375 [Planctomycetes bacterium]|nr:hypothetical protein [Planctomycetota bacterium]
MVATPVEACLALDAGILARGGTFLRGAGAGRLSWKNAFGQEVSSVLWDLEPTAAGAVLLRLRYTVRRWGGFERNQGEEVVEAVRLQTTRPNFGGVRWWFACPLAAAYSPCGRRVSRLYLPPGGRYFGCRTCYGLTYRSVQERRSWHELSRQNPRLALAVLDRRVRRLVRRSSGGRASARHGDR